MMREGEQAAEGERRRILTSFPQFRKYCQSLSDNLNELEGYTSHYRISQKSILKQHDGQFLEVQHRGAQRLLKINILYSLAYQIPILYFMAYNEDMAPINSQKLGEIYQLIGTSKLLETSNLNTGVYITQNPITRDYMYTLHSCELSMEVHLLIPYYLSLLDLNPTLLVNCI